MAQTEVCESGQNVSKGLLDRFCEQPERVWIRSEDSAFTGQELLRYVGRRQAGLKAAGVERGDRILVFSDRGATFWIDTMAVWGLGAVAVPVEASVPARSMRAILEKSEPRFAIGMQKQAPTQLDDVTLIDDGLARQEQPEIVAVQASSLANILFTSGTTGEPKGVMLSHGSVRGNALSTRAVVGIQPDWLLFAAVPYRFVSALSHFLVTVYSGAAYLGIERRLLQADFVEMLFASGADAFGGSPVQARWIASAPEKLQSLKWLMSSGDNLPVQVIDQLRQGLPSLAIVTAYGLTEVGGRFCILEPGLVDRLHGSVGRPIEGLAVEMGDENGEHNHSLSEGEVCIRGDFLFGGYANDQAKTSAVFVDGVFGSGDLGRFDDEGYLYLSGRADDVFKSGGLKVSTLPVAAALLNTGVFADVAVVPCDDDLFGKVAHAYYVLAPGRSFERGAVLRELRKDLPSSHLPRYFTELPEIPRTGSGKVRRSELAGSGPPNAMPS